MSPARLAAAHACREWALPEPTLVRTGMSSLYSAGDTVVRVVPGRAPTDEALWLVGALTRRGVRVARHVRAPLVLDGCTVFGLERLADVGAIDWREVGAMLRRVHDWAPAEVAAHHPLAIAADFAWWRADEMLAEVADLIDIPARRGLEAAIAAHGDWRDRAGTPLVCHGDVHPGNVLQTADGPVLLDWDLLCLAPVAWDHAPMITWEHRWGGEPGAYERLAAGYGTDLRGDPLAESLAVMRNVAATMMRVRAGRNDPAAAAEAQRRLAYWRGDVDAPQWRAM